MNFIKELLPKILILNRNLRVSILILIDFILISFSGFFGIIIYDINLIDNVFDIVLIALILPILGIFVYAVTGQYKSLTRYVSSSYFYILVFRNIFLVLLSSIVFNLFWKSIPTIFWILLFFTSAALTTLLRIIIKDLIRHINIGKNNLRKNVVIYGAGSAGHQLAISLKLSSSKYLINFFVDDDSTLWNSNIGGFKIYSPKVLGNYRNNIDQIFLAIPSLNPKKRREIFNHLKAQGYEILVIPSIDEIASDRMPIDSLRPIQIEDLLSRDSVASDPRLLGPGITNKSICVTGAGGSIGSEICRQIMLFKPKKLILFELCEFNLYKINKELLGFNFQDTEIIPILGNASNFKMMEKVFQKYSIEVIYHSAAYKHVPLVEINPIEGILNNIFSTKTVCQLAEKLSIKEVILLSSDKAVRPTSVMGVTKRISELIFQAFAEKVKNSQNSSIKYSMVRFGNVLDSSGSVVPLFREQIAKGGPVSITHKDVTRYFMTIKEASQLVLQSAVLSEGGDVFLLDMGEPIKILNLAEQMITLSGQTIKKNNISNGDIEIIFTGLRPGEKLYEELLIDAKSKPTMHPLIFRAMENAIPFDKLMPKLIELEEVLLSGNLKKVFLILKELVPEWKNDVSIDYEN